LRGTSSYQNKFFVGKGASDFWRSPSFFYPSFFSGKSLHRTV